MKGGGHGQFKYDGFAFQSAFQTSTKFYGCSLTKQIKYVE